MDRQQAEQCFRAIYGPYGKHLQPEKEQAQAMMTYLLRESYEITWPAIDMAVKVNSFPPVPSDIEKAKAQIAESHRYDTPSPIPIDAASIAHQDELLRMSDQDYMRYLAERRRSA